MAKGCLTVYQTTNFVLVQIESICRRNINVTYKWKFFIGLVENIVGKGENAGYQQLRAISSFPTVFSKDLYSRHVKNRACLGKG